jgi:hypothetical protein
MEYAKQCMGMQSDNALLSARSVRFLRAPGSPSARPRQIRLAEPRVPAIPAGDADEGPGRCKAVRLSPPLNCGCGSLAPMAIAEGWSGVNASVFVVCHDPECSF